MQKTLNTLPPLIALGLIALTPIFNIGETGGLLAPGTISQPQNFLSFQTPIWIKAIKDVSFWALMILGLARFWRARAASPRLWLAALALALTVMASIAASILHPSGITAAQIYAGLRWALPLFLAFGLMGLASESDLKKIAVLLGALMLVNFAAQIYQSVAHLAVPAPQASSVFPRVSGFFYIPSTAGFFACAAAFWTSARLRGGRGRWLALAVGVSAPASIIMAASAGAMACWLVTMFFLAFRDKWLKKRLALLPVFMALIALNINMLSARADILSYSAPKRLEIFAKAAQEIGPISSHFGAGTNAGVILNRSLGAMDESIITDSFYTSVIINLGWLGGLVALGLMAALGWLCLRSGQSAPLAFFALYSVMSLGTVFTEAFPMNLLFAVWLGSWLSDQRSTINQQPTTNNQ